MTVSSTAQEAIALLIDTAQRGEIDPWDVQVIEVIDRYLSTLSVDTGGSQSTFEANLSQSGQAFLWASMLVLLKADTLSNQSTPEEEQEPIDEDLGDDFSSQFGQLPSNLERHIRRRPSAMPPQRRPVTLQDLIEQIKQIADILEEKVPAPKIRRRITQSSTQAARAIAALAHQENLTEVAGQLERLLADHWPLLPPGQDWLHLDQLVSLWAKTPASVEAEHLPEAGSHRSQSNDRVGVFWALLLLSAQSKVELAQEEFYQDIKIRAL